MEDDKRTPPAADDDAAAAPGVDPKRPRLGDAFLDEYGGYRLPYGGVGPGSGPAASAAAPPSPASSISRVGVGDVDPRSFHRDYVSARRPVVLGGGGLPDSNWRVPGRWTLSYLRERAGDVEVAVERRSGPADRFGRGAEERAPLREFLDLLEGGSGMYYLTTQDVRTDPAGRPRVLSDLMTRLSDDFPLRPRLAGNLIPQNVNVWMGRSVGGTSSGLHHDYHDNLYVMVRGRKRFDLYCPSDAPNLYTRGRLRRIHRNGRINYEGEETRADGSQEGAEAALDASLRREEAAAELEEAEAAAGRGEDGAEERLEAAERALDDAMEAVLDAESDDGDGDGDGDGGVGFGGADDDDDDDVDGEEEELPFWVAVAKKKEELSERAEAGGEDQDRDPVTKKKSESTKYAVAESPPEDGDDFSFEEEEGRVLDKTVKDPLNFSLVDTGLDREVLREKFPKFLRARVASVEIGPGDILYLPASWFHEVTSYGGDGEEDGKGGYHMAFNYWFHPPDGDSFDKPYASAFWEKDWNLRKVKD